ncbi:MAG: transcription termination/antitermination protein NusG [Candidatus Margulisbacteria bacterium]|nr:transcription termination/antitermination protein NusG [Candidatus Margulisiibacteriota bacterium]
MEENENNPPAPVPESAVPEGTPAEPEAPLVSEDTSVPEDSSAGKEKEDEALSKIVREAPKGERRWYVIQAMTGLEDRVKKAIELTIESENIKDRVFQVLVPVEETVEIKGGKRVEKVRKMFPGYVFLEMILDEVSWYLIRQTPGVARFIGTKVQPTPVSDKEMQRVLKQLGKEERLEVSFEKGEGVRIISGAFRGYTGTVDEVSESKGKLKVLINIFGRDTPVEVNFEHAQKIV